MEENLVIEKVDDVYMKVHCEPGLAFELSEYFTFSVPGYFSFSVPSFFFFLVTSLWVCLWSRHLRLYKHNTSTV